MVRLPGYGKYMHSRKYSKHAVAEHRITLSERFFSLEERTEAMVAYKARLLKEKEEAKVSMARCSLYFAPNDSMVATGDIFLIFRTGSTFVKAHAEACMKEGLRICFNCSFDDSMHDKVILTANPTGVFDL